MSSFLLCLNTPNSSTILYCVVYTRDISHRLGIPAWSIRWAVGSPTYRIWGADVDNDSYCAILTIARLTATVIFYIIPCVLQLRLGFIGTLFFCPLQGDGIEATMNTHTQVSFLVSWSSHCRLAAFPIDIGPSLINFPNTIFSRGFIQL